MKEVTVDMGFDLTGIQPSGMTIPRPLDWNNKRESEEYFSLLKTVDGAYFRNNNWWWRPLWEMVCSVSTDILDEKDMLAGGFNDSHCITSDKATRLGNRLWKLLDNGSIDKLIDARKKWIATLEDEECHCCEGTGTREGWEGWKSEKEWLKHHDSLKPKDRTGNSPLDVGYEWAHKCKGCNACNGKGKTPHFENSYQIDKENVRNFATFCLKSGGFVIS